MNGKAHVDECSGSSSSYVVADPCCHTRCHASPTWRLGLAYNLSISGDQGVHQVKVLQSVTPVEPEFRLGTAQVRIISAEKLCDGLLLWSVGLIGDTVFHNKEEESLLSDNAVNHNAKITLH